MATTSNILFRNISAPFITPLKSDVQPQCVTPLPDWWIKQYGDGTEAPKKSLFERIKAGGLKITQTSEQKANSTLISNARREAKIRDINKELASDKREKDQRRAVKGISNRMASTVAKLEKGLGRYSDSEIDTLWASTQYDLKTLQTLRYSDLSTYPPIPTISRRARSATIVGAAATSRIGAVAIATVVATPALIAAAAIYPLYAPFVAYIEGIEVAKTIRKRLGNDRLSRAIRPFAFPLAFIGSAVVNPFRSVYFAVGRTFKKFDLLPGALKHVNRKSTSTADIAAAAEVPVIESFERISKARDGRSYHAAVAAEKERIRVWESTTFEGRQVKWAREAAQRVLEEKREEWRLEHRDRWNGGDGGD